MGSSRMERTTDAVSGEVIEDVGIDPAERRSLLFRRTPRRADIRTVFGYCEDPEHA